MSAAVATQPWTPRIARVDAIDPAGRLFHVGSPVENFRVTRLGGEQAFLERILSAVRIGDVFFDIGACVGLVSVHARGCGATVVAFEPEPTFRGRLAENLALNDMGDTRIVDWAVSDSAGEVSLFTDGQHGMSPSLSRTADRGTMTVRTGTIDAAISRGDLPWPTVVKMDIEGAEVKALRGMKRLLNSVRRPRAVFIEVHPPMLASLGDDAADVRRIMTDAGYELTYDETREAQVHHVWTVNKVAD